MNPAQIPASPRPALLGVPATLPPMAPNAPARGLPLAWAGLMLGLGAVALGSGAAYGLVLSFGTSQPWAAPLAAALGVTLAGLPLALLTSKFLRDMRSAAAHPGANAALGLTRPLFMDLAQREWARARRYGSGAALLLIDVDRYARLCEARGPAAGEAVLAELLRQTAASLRPADILTRYSQTQMAVLLAHADATGALDVAERIRDRAEQLEVVLDGADAPAQRVRITVSAGVAHLRPAHLSLQALVDDAEDAVAAARQGGGNCVRAAPIEPGRARGVGSLRGERRAHPKQGGPTK